MVLMPITKKLPTSPRPCIPIDPLLQDAVIFGQKYSVVVHCAAAIIDVDTIEPTPTPMPLKQGLGDDVGDVRKTGHKGGDSGMTGVPGRQDSRKKSAP
jgi:hypothetical protein